MADCLSARPETYWQNSMIINYAVEKCCLRANTAGGALITVCVCVCVACVCMCASVSMRFRGIPRTAAKIPHRALRNNRTWEWKSSLPLRNRFFWKRTWEKSLKDFGNLPSWQAHTSPSLRDGLRNPLFLLLLLLRLPTPMYAASLLAGESKSHDVFCRCSQVS